MGKKGNKARSEKGRITRNQRKALQKSSQSSDPEDLDGQLRNLGLATKNIIGDGNCLFRALSDQYYGHDSNHKAIRQEICQFLRDNEEEYKFFVEDDQSFEHHVECMSQNATYGGNMELAAFAKMKEVNIKVYQPGMIYVINGKEGDDDESVQVLHIAYHSWEHYSSVRNIDGPYSGPPEIEVRKAEECSQNNSGGEEEEQEGLSSKEKVVLNACPGTNIRKIRRLLLKYKGDPDKVIDALYDSEQEVFDTSNAKSTRETDQLKTNKDDEQDEKIDSIKDLDVKENAEKENNKENLNIDQDNSTESDTNVKLDQQIKDVEKDLSKDADKKQDEDTTSTENKSIDKNVDVVSLKLEKLEIETVQNEDNEIKTHQEETEDTQHKEIEPVKTTADKIDLKKPKKLSARERKEQAKRKQKESKLEKERAKAARKSRNSVEPISKQNTNNTKMKEMHI